MSERILIVDDDPVQRRLLDSYMTEVLTDPLTGLSNRRKFDQELARRFAQFRRRGTPLTLVLVERFAVTVTVIVVVPLLPLWSGSPL